MAEEPYDDLDIGYVEWPMPTTEEITVIRFLNKNGLVRLWQKMKDKFVQIPYGGKEGQALIKTSTGYGWSDLSGLPEVLPVEQGGTGCTTIEGIRTMLFNFPTDQEVREYYQANK